jgi:hypothetical protein
MLLFGAGAISAADDPAGSAPLLLAQITDVRQEDRQADRLADRQADRRQGDDGLQARVPLPRTAAGEVDVGALLPALDANFDNGIREIQVRDSSLTPVEARNLFLAETASANLLRQIGDQMPTGNGEWTVRFRSGTVDARVQRQPDGSLRARVEGADLTGLTAAQRADLARTLSQTGFDRVRVEGVDADGKRVRTEFRADRGLVKNVVQGSGNLARGADDARRAADDSGVRREDRRADRQDDSRADSGSNRGSVDRSGSSERVTNASDRQERGQRPDRGERPNRPERSERADRPDRPDRPERADRPDRPDRPERVERAERPDRPERVERAERSDRPDRPDRPDRSGSGSGR